MTADVVRASQLVFKRHESELTDPNRKGKLYFFNILAEDDLRGFPVLLEFALSEPITKAVMGYMGHVPRLNAIGVFYSAVSDAPVEGSQKYHVDGDAFASIKGFVNVWDVAMNTGALCFLPKSLTSTAFRSGGLLKTLSDDDVHKSVPQSREIVVTGPPGSGVLVDTSRCLHQGG